MSQYRVAVITVVEAKNREAAFADVIGKVARKDMTEVHVRNLDTNEQFSVTVEQLRKLAAEKAEAEEKAEA